MADPGGTDTVSWFCSYTPLEILDAAGLTPVRIFGDPAALESADSLLHPAICPYVRACLAGAMEDDGPHHAVFVNSCDGLRRLYDSWADLFPENLVYLMDMPRNEGQGGERLLVEEYRTLIRYLEKRLETEITAPALREAGRAREERRLAFLELAGDRCGAERLNLAMRFHTHPDGAFPVALAGADNGGGIPIVLTGSLLNPAGLVASLDRAGARVAWIDLCNGDRGFASPTEPEGEEMDQLLFSLARGYLGRHPCARMLDSGRRYDLLVEKVREVGARGVVYAYLSFCDSYLYDFPRAEKRLAAAGIPVLRLESDYGDGHAGQLLTRMEAFLEML